MRRCPITYEIIDDNVHYSRKGLNQLSRRLTDLSPLPLTASEQRQEAGARSDKMSIQGMQPKLSAILNIKKGRFEIVDRNGKYILKPQCEFEEIPQNEAITMTMAGMIGIEVPVHGLLFSKDGSFTYFIKRFDRTPRKGKLQVEDFAQLSGESRETKYRSSIEKVASIIEKHTSFPVVEKVKLFTRTLFAYLIGNEDMHLKNFSLIVRDDKVELSPAYDLVNSTIALPRAKEELALPLNVKKSKIKRSDLIDYFGMQRLGLTKATIDDILAVIDAAMPKWFDLIQQSFLSARMKENYMALLKNRSEVLEL
ncbi:MAG: HipA domain-containing protein [Pseudomonadota bacterium]